MKRVLLISYYYPPLNDVGGLRALGFSKYLPNFGWKPYVLTVANPDKSYCTVGNGKAPAEIEVSRSNSIMNLSKIVGKLNGFLAMILKQFGRELRTNVFADLFCLPDIFIGWIPLTFLKALSIIRKEKIDVIYVSCKPFSSSLIALLLGKATRKPVILDLRDPVITTPDGPKTWSMRFNVRFNRFLENYVFRRVDQLILVTSATRRNYIAQYPWLEEKSTFIYNGFFEEYLPRTDLPLFDQFTITYVGNYYSEYGDTELPFHALKQVLSNGNVHRSKIRFSYLGANHEFINSMANKFGLGDVVEAQGPVSREKSIEALFRSSVIYIRIVRDMISTKLFEGLTTGHPLLVATANEEVIGLIKQYSPRSAIVEPKNAAAFAGAIEEMYNRWYTKREDWHPNEQYLARFNKRALTEIFADVLNEFAANSRG